MCEALARVLDEALMHFMSERLPSGNEARRVTAEVCGHLLIGRLGENVFQLREAACAGELRYGMAELAARSVGLRLPEQLGLQIWDRDGQDQPSRQLRFWRM